MPRDPKVEKRPSYAIVARIATGEIEDITTEGKNAAAVGRAGSISVPPLQSLPLRISMVR